jgi:phosphatidylserine/phosphatidylglycerophosphate/cardiolipin synthase-like enzyme
MPTNVQWDVHFSPNGGATETLVRFIDGASKSIYVQAYSFTSAPIAVALVNAHKRGVHVEVILDKSDVTGRGTVLPMLKGHGIPTFIDDKHAIAHNKVMVIDQVTVFTGSFNFTNAAEHANAENSIRLTDPRIATVYQENWNAHRGHSR